MVNATVARALAAGTFGVALSDSGWLLPWYVGVLLVLQRLGVVQLGVTPLGGVSGGGVVAALFCSGVPPERGMEVIQSAAASCRARASCKGTLAQQLAPVLSAALPHDAHTRCANATRIFVSRPAAGPPGATLGPLLRSTPEQVGTGSFEAFRDGVLTTAFIPFWSSAGRATTPYLGRPGFEGVYSLPMPCPPATASPGGVCLRLSARFAGPLASKRPVDEALVGLPLPLRPAPADLAPGVLTPVDLTAWQIGYRLALLPGTRGQLDYLYRKGQEDARAWARAALGLELGLGPSAGGR